MSDRSLQQAKTSRGGFRSLEMVKTKGALRLLALLLCLFAMLSAAALAYVPWQQSVLGRGAVTAFTPKDRPQTVEAPIPGRVAKWLVKEGDAVSKGDLLCVLDDLEARFLDPNQPKIVAAQLSAMRQRRLAIQGRLQALETQRDSISASRDAAMATATQKISQAQARATMADQGVRASSQTIDTARINHERMQRLQSAGLRSKRDLELAQLDKVRAETELERSRAAAEVARREITGAQLEREKVAADTAAGLSSLQASQQQARESLASIDADLLKLEAELSNLQRRTEQRKVLAPGDGVVARIAKAGAGEVVKAGDDLCVLVPQTVDVAVELWVNGWDAPLLSPGRPVRLIFDGFPAVPFTAWPWASVGTFGGRIAVIDSVDDGSGKYRVLVRPDKSERWPPSSRLRAGTRTVGWIMLDNVPLYWEVWRRLNAFPATVDVQKADKGGTKSDKEAKTSKPVLK